MKSLSPARAVWRLALLPAASLLWATMASAQAPSAAKPAPKPATTSAATPAPAAKPADGATRSFGTGAGSGPLLTREELRACLTQEEDIRKRVDAAAAQRAALNDEKSALTAERDALTADRGTIDAAKKAIDDLSGRYKVHGERVQRWNERAKVLGETTRTGASIDRERAALNNERVDLEKERAALETERTQLAAQGEEAVKAFNAKASAIDGRVTDWNVRNQKWSEAAAAIDSEREAWVKSCANRRYREDDENAIRRGK
jgi:predicted  nucleic acid-binding Zn-ribbon protein